MIGPVESTTKEVTVSCTECNDFEFTKTYSGWKHTEGERQYDDSGGFESCPVCDGELDRREQ